MKRMGFPKMYSGSIRIKTSHNQQTDEIHKKRNETTSTALTRRSHRNIIDVGELDSHDMYDDTILWRGKYLPSGHVYSTHC